MALVLMNNCRRRDHVWHFGPEAFFDLLREGKQAEMATDIRSGDVCIVATQDRHRKSVTFTWYTLSREKNMIDKDDVRCRVFFGEQTKAEVMPKKKAAKSSIYGAFFNRIGHFKQISVVPF